MDHQKLKDLPEEWQMMRRLLRNLAIHTGAPSDVLKGDFEIIDNFLLDLWAWRAERGIR